MKEINDLLAIIEINFKNQFMVDKVYRTAKLAAFAAGKGKSEMSQRKLKQFDEKYVYGQTLVDGLLVDTGTKICDVTGTLKKFSMLVNKKNKETLANAALKIAA
jgi:hypothetical protein